MASSFVGSIRARSCGHEARPINHAVKHPSNGLLMTLAKKHHNLFTALNNAKSIRKSAQQLITPVRKIFT